MIHQFLNKNIRVLGVVGVLCSMLLLWPSCDPDDGDSVDFSELGAVNAASLVEEEGGTIDIQIYASHATQAYLAENYSWVTLMTSKVDGDGLITVNCDPNESFRRMAKIYITSPETDRLDSIVVKQKGSLKVIFESSTPNVKILSAEGPISIPFTTNVDIDDIDVSLFGETETEKSWVNHDFAIDTDFNRLDFSVTANDSETELRNARIMLKYTDGWDSIYNYSLYLIQANAKDEFGTLVSFEQARTWAGDKVSSYEFIEGYVISQTGNGNMGDCPQKTNTSIDYDANLKTAYIQSLDGKYGFMIVTKSVEDNVFNRYSKVQLLLKDTEVLKEENPSRYTIRNVTSAMVLSSEAGSYTNLVAKEKFMNELTDDDVYTFVTLKDAEFPIRKGPLTPVNEGYTPVFDANRISKFPVIIRDIKGGSMHLFTNITCPYRRDGRILPYGSGKISGILVHETFTRYEYEDTDNEETWGQIGRYQLRHVAWEDIQFASSLDYSFSALLAEYQYPNLNNGMALPTNGTNGSIRVSFANGTANIGAIGTDLSYLGPCGRPATGNVGNINQYGNGVLNPDGTKQNTDTRTNTGGASAGNDGKGFTYASTWGYSGVWWNTQEEHGECFIIDFSTKNLQTDQLSLQLVMTMAMGGPRFWNLEWSEDGKLYTSDDPEDTSRQFLAWNYIESFTLSETIDWSLSFLHQMPGYKYLNFNLPLDLLNKDKVYLRLIPAKNSAGSGINDANNYQGVPITTAKAVYFSYVGIRYNK